jgi:hypothetical protein
MFCASNYIVGKDVKSLQIIDLYHYQMAYQQGK